MTPLRLGTHNLHPAEVVLLSTLLRLFSYDESFHWTLVEEGPYDALVVDGTTPGGVSAETNRLAKVTLRLTRMHAGSAPNTLERPIRADRLRQWLDQTERELKGRTPGISIKRAAPAGHQGSLPSHVRFRLRRWPPPLLLRNNVHRVRMATLLSRRPLSAEELADISDQGLDVCATFLQVLRSADLLESEQGATCANGPNSKA